MYKKMLVLLDGSKLAEAVFSYARELSGRFGLDLDLLHVCTSQEAEQMPMRQAYVEHMAEVLKKQSEDIRSKTGVKTSEKPVEVKGKVVTGYPADEILKYADENNIDLIMLSTHGTSGIRRWGLGSVAHKVIHEAKVPIWLVPSELHSDILFDRFEERSVLIPLDGNKPAEAILPHIQALTVQRGLETEFVLINVAILPPMPMFGNAIEWAKDLSTLKKAGEEYLNKIVKQLQDAGFKATAVVLEGDPAEEIVKYAAEHHPRLIAMSTHSRLGVNRFMFGSVVEDMVQRLKKTPLFLVGPKEE